MEVLAVCPEVVAEVIYTLSEDGYLHTRGPGVTLFGLELPYQGLLPLRPQHLLFYDLSLFSSRGL